jgi:sugar phosphate isomerase/epimerase
VLDARVQQAVETLELASQLRLPVVSARLGPLLDADGRASQQTMEAIQLVAARADQMGVSFAVETGPDEPGVLAERLRELACPSLGVCLDPAGLVQFGYDPGEAASRFAELIGLSRVADAYAGGRGRPGAETALGQGQLDLAGYLAHLAGGDYCGPLILRRRQSLNPTSELQAGLALLQQALA